MKRVKRTFRSIFLDKLTEMSNKGGTLVGNRALRDALRWDEERYQRIKDQLHEETVIIVGRGRGGTVGLADAPGGRGLNVFVSYSHADEDLKNELVKHLEPLRRLQRIKTWHDRKITPGDEWEKSISGNLELGKRRVLPKAATEDDWNDDRLLLGVTLHRILKLHIVAVR